MVCYQNNNKKYIQILHTTWYEKKPNKYSVESLKKEVFTLKELKWARRKLKTAKFIVCPLNVSLEIRKAMKLPKEKL